MKYFQLIIKQISVIKLIPVSVKPINELWVVRVFGYCPV